jgi:hypothetical protein
MSSPTKRTNLKRTGLILVSVLALVGTGTVAWGHGSAVSSIPDPADGRIHACFPNNAPRTLRVVAPTQTCSASQSGVDWPANGVLTQLTESAAVPVSLPATALTGSNSAVVSCAPKQAIGVTFQSPDLTKPVALVGSTRGGAVPGTELTVTFTSLTANAQTIQVRALCVTSFAQ